MKKLDIVYERLRNQLLTYGQLEKPEEVVSWLGAVQAQDFAAAKWGLGLRMKNASDSIVEQAFNEGKILRTHVMRPTWHFVSPADIRWMLKLTGPRVSKVMSSYNKKLELDESVFKKSNDTIVGKFKNNKYLTRGDIKAALGDVGIHTDVQRLAHLVMQAELEALICSGPRLGKQFSYALLEDRVAKAPELSREEALAKLTLKYFSSHGPAQLRDFVWWSGLSKGEAKEGLELIKPKLVEETIEGKTYWFPENKQSQAKKLQTTYLLSIYDEYTIAYNDRSALGDGRYFEKLILMGNTLTAVIILGGEIAGTWKRVINKSKVEVTLSPFREFNKSEIKSLKSAVARYGQFLGLPVLLR